MNVVRRQLVALGLLAPALVSLAPAPAVRYTPLHLHEMALGADLIVTGTVDRMLKGNFAFSIDRVVAGELPKGVEDELVVARFQDWTCASRWAPYAPGQRVTLFLQRRKTTGGKSPYRIMSGGGEGEMPMTVRSETNSEGETKAVKRVLLRGRGLDGLGGKRHTLGDGSTVFGAEVEIDVVAAAVAEYQKCFGATMSKKIPGRIETIERKVPSEQVTRLTASSPVARALVQKTLLDKRFTKPSGR